MDLLDDFESIRGAFGDLGDFAARAPSLQSGPGLEEGDISLAAATPSTSYDLPTLTVDVTLRQAAR
jgi:hypothetical protein